MTGQRIKVAQIVTRLQAGAGAVALRGADALDPDRFEIHIIAGSGDRLLTDAASRFPVTVVPSLRSPIAPGHDLHAIRDLTSHLRAIGPDVVHTHSSKAGALGRLAARRVGVATVVHTYHGFPFHEFQSAPRRHAYVALERRLGRLTDHVLCVGTAVAAVAVRLRLAAPEAIRAMGVPVDVRPSKASSESRDKARKLLGIDPGARVVGCVGRLDYQKDPITWLRALRSVPDEGIVGVWVGSGSLEERLRTAVNDLSLNGRVIFAGERADVAELLPAFDVFAMSSRYEGLPLALVEAILAGVPVVATAVNGVSDIVSPGETGLLVPPGRPELLGRAIGYLLDHSARASAMSAAAQHGVNGRYSSNTLATVLTDVYSGPN